MKFRDWKEHYLIAALKILEDIILSTNCDFIAVFRESKSELTIVFYPVAHTFLYFEITD